MSSAQTTLSAPAPAMTAPVSTQPMGKSSTMKMKTLEPQNRLVEEPCTHGNATRLRGGGAAKDCFIGLFSCFVCFECCEGCCECAADILCCPCEMCC